MSVHVCLSVCPIVYTRYLEPHGQILPPISVRVACGRGSVLLWWRCDTLRISGFMDDVMFSRNS